MQRLAPGRRRSAPGGDIETVGEPAASAPAADEDAIATRARRAAGSGRKAAGRRTAADLASADSATTSSQTVLLAAVAAACVTVASALLLTLWAYLTATGSRDLSRPLEIDPVFEVRDRLVWLSALAGGGAAAVVLAWNRRPVRRLLESWPVVVLAVAGTGGIAASIAWVDPQFGLSLVNLLLGFAVVPLLVVALVHPNPDGVLRLLWPPVAAVGVGLYLPTLVQTPGGMYDAYHASRVIDELLGPVAGNLPLSDYISQYGGLLGLPLIPFHALVASHVEWAIMAYLSVLSILTVAALCVAAALMLPRGRRVLAPILVVPVLLMKPSAPEALLPDGVQRLFQSMPERSLLPVLLAVALLWAVSRPQATSRWVWVGGVAGLAALNNFESGVPATVSAVLAVVALRAGWRAFGYATAGWLGVAAAYVGLILVSGGPFRPEYWWAFSLEFAGGFAQLPMPPYGAYVLVLFVLVASVASAFPVVWRRGSSMPVAAVGGLYFGFWGLMMFPYYVGRSSSLGQLQFFLIPASVAAVWLLVGAVGAVQRQSPAPRLAYAALLCFLPAAVFATTVIKAPTPETNYKRLTGGFAPAGEFRSTASSRFKPQPVVGEAQARVILAESADLREPVGLFFTSGHVASLRTGLPNASVLAVPEELMPLRPWSVDPTDTGNAAFRRMQCRALETSELNSVIAEAIVAAGLDTCAGFTRQPEARGMVVFTRDAG